MKPHPLDAHARALHEHDGNQWTFDQVRGNYLAQAAAVLRVELCREPSEEECDEVSRAIYGPEQDATQDRYDMRVALKAAMAARLKALGLISPTPDNNDNH